MTEMNIDIDIEHIDIYVHSLMSLKQMWSSHILKSRSPTRCKFKNYKIIAF